MNAYRGMVKKGVAGQEDALQALNLLDVDPLPFDDSTDVNGPKIAEDFRTLIHQEGLAQTAKFGMEALYYLKTYMGLEDLEYYLSKQDMTSKMLTSLDNLRQFLVTRGSLHMRRNFMNVTDSPLALLPY